MVLPKLGCMIVEKITQEAIGCGTAHTYTSDIISKQKEINALPNSFFYKMSYLSFVESGVKCMRNKTR